MLVLAVIAEPFAVIGEKNDRAAIVEGLVLQERNEAADDRVRGGDIAVVRRAVARVKRLGRVVGRVRLVDVEEEEKRSRLRPGDPLLGDGPRLLAAALRATHAEEVRVDGDVVVPEVEAAANSGLAAKVIEDASQVAQHIAG